MQPTHHDDPLDPGDHQRVIDVVTAYVRYGEASPQFRGQLALIHSEYGTSQLIQALISFLLPYARMHPLGVDEVIACGQRVSDDFMAEERSEMLQVPE